MKPTIKFDLRVGDLTEVVTYQTPVYNSPRDEIVGWQDFVTVRASVSPTDIQSDEQFHAARETAIQYYVLRHWFVPGLLMEMRAVHRNKAYDIRAIADVMSKRRQHFVTCREVE